MANYFLFQKKNLRFLPNKTKEVFSPSFLYKISNQSVYIANFLNKLDLQALCNIFIIKKSIKEL